MYKLTDTFVLILLIFAVFYLSLIQHYIKCLQFFYVLLTIIIMIFFISMIVIVCYELEQILDETQF